MPRIIMSIIRFIKTRLCGSYRRNTDYIDGGVKTYSSGEDSPKVVKSTDIISFEFDVSLYSIVLEECELVGRNYKLSAVLEDRVVKAQIKWRDRVGDSEDHNFTVDASFMTSIQKIVSKYNFAQYNGYISKVSGLPDMYGVKIYITYTSGESIYAFNNQDCFVPFDAIAKLIDIFNCAYTD